MHVYGVGREVVCACGKDQANLIYVPQTVIMVVGISSLQDNFHAAIALQLNNCHRISKRRGNANEKSDFALSFVNSQHLKPFRVQNSKSVYTKNDRKWWMEWWLDGGEIEDSTSCGENAGQHSHPFFTRILYQFTFLTVNLKHNFG